MKVRCKHQNGTLFEWVEAAHTRLVRDGTMEEDGYNELGNITSYEYQCDECGRHWKYPATPARPVWLRRIHEQLQFSREPGP